ncbi:MAG: VanW family protein [Lachnospiraceae bacterium]|nr:VanW family protein [Lachnospiraceae bacterium]
MKRSINKGCFSVLLVAMTLFFGMTVQAKGEETIKTGVYADGVDLSGKTAQEATAAIEAYVEALKPVELTLLAADNNEVITTAGELGITWTNTEVVSEALEIGTQGNIIERYKILKDLEQENQVLSLEFAFDIEAINNILANEATKFDQEAVNVSLTRENGEFKIIEGQTGYMLDVETSIDLVYNYLVEEWNHQPSSIALDIVVDEPKGSREELAQVTDVLGSFTTSFRTSNSSRSANVVNGCNLINGITLYPGEEFSTYEMVSPFSVENGYHMAGSYMNGKVVDSLGGGICQVSTTLYNAVLLSELEVTERHNHSMIVAYVDPSADAAIAESSGKDFRFVNNTDYPIYIEGYTENKKITFNIYGKETRPANREVIYDSKVLQVINPTVDQIYADAGQPLGYIITESAHIGYKAQLWKIVKEDGIEVSREQINSSNYKMTPRSATVGTATADPQHYEEIMAAIGTANIDHVKNVIAYLQAQTAQQQAQQAESEEE